MPPIPLPSVVPGMEAAFNSALPVLIALAGLGVAIGFLVHQHRRRRAKEASLDRLARRNPGWSRTATPCGISADRLADRCAATPRGDRRYGVRYGIEGPVELALGHRTSNCDAGFFQWFSEERSTSRSADGARRTTYRERREVVGMVRLPVACPAPIRIGSESLLGRFGLTRGGEQVESAEFNRRFRVEGGDRTLTVQLLDANLQEVLLRRYQGRTVELDADMLVLGGRPDHRDESLTGVVGEFPAVREDLEALVAQFPAQYWRAVGVDRLDEESER